MSKIIWPITPHLAPQKYTEVTPLLLSYTVARQHGYYRYYGVRIVKLIEYVVV